MWSLTGLVQPPMIACFQTFDQTLKVSEQLEPRASGKTPGKNVLLKKLHGPTKADTGAKKALAASLAGDTNAPLLWKSALQTRPPSRSSCYSQKELTQHNAAQRQKQKQALEQPVEGHATLIEALVASHDWASMAAVAYQVPQGRYADGRVSNEATWFGGSQGGLAHGPVIGKQRFRPGTNPPALPASIEVATFFNLGHPQGHCTYKHPTLPAELHAQYVSGKRIEAVNYTQAGSGWFLHIEGPWVGEAEQGLPQGASCTWRINRGGAGQHFEGSIHCAAGAISSDLHPLLSSSPLAQSVGHITRLNGTLAQSGSSNTILQGDFTRTFSAGTWAIEVTGRGTLTLASSSISHPGSPEVAQGCVTGIWKDNALVSGDGEVTLLDGTHYKGQFGAAGAYHGAGTLTLANGTRYQGQFDKGDIVEQVALAWPTGEQVTGTLRRPATSQPKTSHKAGVITFVDGTEIAAAP